MSSFSLGWKDNALVWVPQTLATAAGAAKCLIRCPKAPWVLDDGDSLVHPIHNTSRVSEGDWFLITKAHTIMYRVRIARFSQNDHKAPSCLKVPLNHCTKGNNFQWTENRYTLPS